MRVMMLVVQPDPGRKHSHLVIVSHRGGGWYEAACMGQARKCRDGECPHARGLRVKGNSRPVRQVARDAS